LIIAKQIAVALELAHERGIIHRDLKPANIKITPEGVVKVLDFGLAKALVGDHPDPTSAATLGKTREGVVVGTAAYMSPEQARGLPVDRRTDIWAFAVVLFEILAGRRPFSGETVTDTLASVLTSEPNWNELPADVRPDLRRLLHRSLRRTRSAASSPSGMRACR
jgi:serine/threonine protein kinase